jgi:hypothetical protein
MLPGHPEFQAPGMRGFRISQERGWEKMIHRESQNGNPARKATTLSSQLNKGLVSYVAAAGAAGVGMLAGAHPAEAEVVYTPANTPILINTPVALDLNNDGIVDFELSNIYRGFARKSCTQDCSFGADATLKVSPEAGNAIWGIPSSVSPRSGKLRRKTKTVKEAAAPAFWGVVVGPERKLKTTPLVMDSDIFSGTIFGFSSNKTFGPWGKGRPFVGSYLGLKFTIDGVPHYGWARITVRADLLTITATLTGYAYETIPNRPIITGVTHGTFDASEEMDPAALDETQAPDPGSLGRLAQGATGLAAWRANQAVSQNAAPAPGK